MHTRTCEECGVVVLWEYGRNMPRHNCQQVKELKLWLATEEARKQKEEAIRRLMERYGDGTTL